MSSIDLTSADHSHNADSHNADPQGGSVAVAESETTLAVRGEMQTLINADNAGPLLLAYRFALAGSLVDDRLRKLSHSGEAIYTRTGGGGEVTQAAMAVALRRGTNAVFARHGCIASVLAVGLSTEQIFLNAFAKAADPAGGGRMLPQTWNSVELGLFSTSPSVGAQLAHAAGMAWSAQREATGAAVVAWISDADAIDGSMYEALDFTCSHRLPLIVVHERRNSSQHLRFADKRLRQERISSGNAIHAHDAMETAIQRATTNQGPTLLIVDVDDRAAISELGAFADQLIQSGIAPADHFLQIESAVRAEIDNATRVARTGQAPAPMSASARVSAELSNETPATISVSPTHDVTVGDAMRLARRRILKQNKNAVLVGNSFPPEPEWFEDFGAKQVVALDAPARLTIGVAIGMSMSGLYPIVQLRHASDALDAFAQIANEAAWMRFRTNGELTAAITIRAPWGAGFRTGPYHARGIEAFFAHVPGLTVLTPSTPADAANSLLSAVHHDGPVLLCEHRVASAFATGPVDDESEPTAFGRAEIVRAGIAATVITYGAFRQLCLNAAQMLSEQDSVNVEVIDLMSIAPLDVETILGSVSRTGRVLIVTEDTVSFGVAAEVSAMISEEAFDSLKAPVRRMALPDAPHAAFATELDSALAITPNQIVAAVRSLLVE